MHCLLYKCIDKMKSIGIQEFPIINNIFDREAINAHVFIYRIP